MKVYSGNLLPKLSSLIDCFVYTYIFCSPSAAVFLTTGNIYRAEEGKITQPQISSQCEWSYGKLSILQWKEMHLGCTHLNHNNKASQYCLWPLLWVLLLPHQSFPGQWFRTTLPTKAISWAQHPHLLEAFSSVSTVALSILTTCSVFFITVIIFCWSLLSSTRMENSRAGPCMSCPHRITRAKVSTP